MGTNHRLEEEQLLQQDGTQAEALSLEEILEQLEKIVERLNEGQCSLEESFQLYKEGMAFLKAGNEKIDAVEKKMLEINEEGDLYEFPGGM